MNWPEALVIAVIILGVVMIICTVLLIRAFDRISREEREAMDEPLHRGAWKGTTLPPRRRQNG